METAQRRATTPLCQIKRPRVRVQLVEKVAVVNQMLTNHHGRVLVLIPQTHILSPETEPKVSMTEKVSHLCDVEMTATALMKRGGNLTHIARSHATMRVTAMMTGTGITNTQVKTALTGPPQGLQDLPQRTNPWTVRAQATGSPMILTLVVLIPVIVMRRLLGMTTLAALYEGMIILLMIRLTKVLGIMVIHLVVILGQQNVHGTPNPSTGALTRSTCEILTPRIRVQVDHRL
jgi:hypothetical protein